MIGVLTGLHQLLERNLLEDWRVSRVIKRQDELGLILHNELARFPLVGLYEGETKDDWNSFVKYLGKIYNDIDGERREIIDRVKVELAKRKDYFDDLLSDIECDSATSIRRIVNRLKFYIPCPEYKKLIDLETSYSKSVQLMQKYELPSSEIKDKILAGMRRKYPEAECQEKFNEVIEKNKLLVQLGKQQVKDLRDIVEANSKYQRFEEMKRELKAWTDEWTNTDSGVGKENIKKGKSFEDVSSKIGVGWIINKLGVRKSDVSVKMNLSWDNCPGEIDIVIFNREQTKVICLAECKSRLFDIVQGYKQSGPNRAAEKTHVLLGHKSIEVPRDTPCYVLTAIPSNDYFLGVESKLKQDLTRYTLENEFHEIDFDEVYSLLRPKYEKLLSPLAWFEKYSKTNLGIFI